MADKENLEGVHEENAVAAEVPASEPEAIPLGPETQAIIIQSIN